ncbi:hypothetical protein DMUE_2685 [Dictyocoela muelleri]|nr:hypothetical protein DMUE_2685 [Dictyocoela muelleri]
MLYNKRQSVKLGGIDSIVEADESLMASAKYGRGDIQSKHGFWHCLAWNRKMLHKSCARSEKNTTLEKIILEIVSESTIICTDQAKMYETLDEIGYIHFVVCHKRNLIDLDIGAHTQTVDSLWNHFKKKKHAEYRISRKD